MSKKKNPEVEELETAEEAVTEEHTAEVVVDTPSDEAAALTALQEELDGCRAELEQQKDLYLRTRAETDNFRRRMQREKEELSKFANESILREILPVIDNLERAVSHARENDADSSSLLDGVEMTLSQFQKVLEKFNVTPVEAHGKPFDPACHEAMGQMESAECAPNTVVQVLQSGYMLNDRLLRPALVMVSKAVADSGASTAAQEN
ncbi:MAG: nucleotide exchange factor GrpE [Desulfuromonas sp.]|nr:MAG: nucleotide exchange factor GrpE [Desulfuromonas sp.]